MTEDFQNSSGPGRRDGRRRGSGLGTHACPAPLSLPDSPLRGPADLSSLCVSHPLLLGEDAVRPSGPSPLAQSVAARSEPSSLSPSCPASSATQASSLGQRRKGLGRKVRNRNHRARGRPSCPAVPRDGDRKSGKADRMEEDAGLEEEQMEAETVAHK